MDRSLKMPRVAGLPPLWLAGAAVTCTWGAVFSVQRLIEHYLQDPAADDFRVYYYAAKLGLQQGWDHIYNQAALKAVMAAHFTGVVVDGGHTYPNLPPLAWMIAPLTVLSFGPAYAAWALIGLSCVVIAWALVAPFRGLARATLLLLAVAIWPIHYSLFFGQPTPEILALVAAAWWCLKRDRSWAAGIALALATSLKPQDLILVPFALLLSRRIAVFGWWVLGCVALGLIFLAALGFRGLGDFWQTTLVVESYPGHKILTMASLAGPGLPAAVVQVLAGVAVLFGAFRRSSNLELVIALGLVGSVATAVHAHESDFAVLVLAAWLVLRSPIGISSRAWLLPGIAAVQLMAIGLAWPVLLWELVWIGLLVGDRIFEPGPALQVSGAPAGQ